MREDNSANPSTILMAAHRFQWNFGRVKLGVGGTIVYARANNQFLITDFLPILIYHNSDSVPNNLAMILDAQWAITPGLNLSLMIGFDDIAGGLIGIPDGDIPTIPGLVLQLEYSIRNKNLFHYYMLETGYTHYLWGNFEYEDRIDDWFGVYLARGIYRYTPNKSAVLLPLTSPYGPGALWGKLKGDLFFPGLNIRAGAELLLLFKNSHVNLIDTLYKADDSLYKLDQWFFALDLPLTYTWQNKAGALEFLFSPALLLSSEGKVFQCTLGLRWSMQGSRFYSSK